ncbi:hypothetical protein Athai_35330 [Actinocatenispora thailandica]|uniref:HTH gntR-type domain-containing protein n=1 Tax=Actinocatenispora thailandica TaxID=227318 RepID=A0A7R7DQI8_9ACTN|nr:winged helix-turn-helix domain-containing protein [Actinocatenispora thailandica]BCJ36030.1 hypothetical protein Athai_35330 [Actinocatenispora thailandica]
MTLDPDISTPLWRQLVDVLVARIEDGTYHKGGRLPSEVSLQQEFGVARGTVRHALQHLVAEGIAETTNGKGTYVRS